MLYLGVSISLVFAKKVEYAVTGRIEVVGGQHEVIWTAEFYLFNVTGAQK